MVKSHILTSALLIVGAAAFAPSSPVAFTRSALRMSDEEPVAEPVVQQSVALVPIKEDTVQFTAGLVGGAIGFAVGGPVLGAFAATATNYISKNDNEASEVISAVSKSSIEIFNYLKTLDSKYTLLKSAQSSLEEALEKLKAQNADSDTIQKIEDALKSTTDKITEVNDEYDIVGAGVTALGVVGDLVEKALVKAGELNDEYKLSDRALATIKEVSSKAVDAAKDKIENA